MQLSPCAACRRHVRVTEPRCPFCAAPRRAKLVRAAIVGGSVAIACATPATQPPAAPLPGTASSEAPAASSAPPASAPPASAPVASQSASQAAPGDSSMLPPEPPRRVVAIYGSPMIIIPERIEFAPQSATIRAESRPLIQQIVGVMEGRPDVRVFIDGHSDPREANPRISEQRAEAVRKALVDLKVDPSRLTVRSFGHSRPLVPSDTPINRAHNRRVSVELNLGP